MRFEPIEINIDDNRLFCIVAFLIDRSDFLEQASKLRKRFRVKSPLSDKGIETMYWKEDDLNVEKLSKKYGIKSKREKGLSHLYTYTKYDRAVDGLRRKFHKGRYFSKAITNAVLKNKITADDIGISAYVPSMEETYIIKLEDHERAIIINPDTKLDDIIKEFKSILFTKVIPRQGPFGSIKYDYQEIAKLPDTISNIKRDRIWYWQKLQGLSYQKIWDQTPKRDKSITRDGVIKAIKQYEKRLR